MSERVTTVTAPVSTSESAWAKKGRGPPSAAAVMSPVAESMVKTALLGTVLNQAGGALPPFLLTSTGTVKVSPGIK